MAFRCGTCTTSDEGVKTCTYVDKTWVVFYANCPNPNTGCRSSSNAYVPAITVCLQNL